LSSGLTAIFIFLRRNKMKMKKIWCVVLILFASATVFADWNRGDPYKMHFPQLPNPIGWDICLHEQFIADDFTCTESGPIRDIHFWVSWKENIEDFLGTSFFVQIRSNQPSPLRRRKARSGALDVEQYKRNRQYENPRP
jgi:hypothetical protein